MHGTDPDPLTANHSTTIALPFVLMRGGTSKAVFLKGDSLPSDRADRDAMILSLFGSPDPRQIDGLGGADLLTSKLAIIDPPSRPDADLDYTFAQVSITEPAVDYDINCGNISAAVGAYAVDEGIVDASGPTASVRIHNTNTGRVLVADVPISDGAAAIEGDYVVHGVPGSGAPIALDFSQTAGGITGSLFPTGNLVDRLDTSIGIVPATIIDLANLTVFFSARDVGMVGTEGPHDITGEHFQAVAAVKTAAAVLVGLDPDGLTPVPAIVSPPASYVSFATNESVDALDVDLVARVVGGRPPVLHKAYPGTLGACTGVAARIPGTTVHDVARGSDADDIRIGHTSGIMPVSARVSIDDGTARIEQAVYHRTARRIAEGTAFVQSDLATKDEEWSPDGKR